MRWLLAAMLLLACAGCGEKTPTAAERATVYLAAEAELERLEIMKTNLLESHRKAFEMNIQFSKAEMEEYQEACDKIDAMIEDTKRVMAENNPTIP
jgi:hypothetical protein